MKTVKQVNVKKISYWSKMKLLLSADRRRVVTLCRIKGKTLSELCEITKKNPSSIYNHLTKLTKAGFLFIERERIINGISEKTYRASAKDFVMNKKIVDVPLDKVNTDISNHVKKSVKEILDEDNIDRVKQHYVYLNEAEFLKIKKLLDKTEQTALNDQSEDGKRYSIVIAFGETK